MPREDRERRRERRNRGGNRSRTNDNNNTAASPDDMMDNNEPNTTTGVPPQLGSPNPNNTNTNGGGGGAHRESLSQYTDDVSSYHDRELAELQLLCDAASESDPNSWEQIRRWLRNHSADDAREAAERRGDYETTPLHLACRNCPPLDIVNMLLTASPKTVELADSFGWLPLVRFIEEGIGCVFVVDCLYFSLWREVVCGGGSHSCNWLFL